MPLATVRFSVTNSNRWITLPYRLSIRQVGVTLLFKVGFGQGTFQVDPAGSSLKSFLFLPKTDGLSYSSPDDHLLGSLYRALLGPPM
jgi:hypothetical protein